MSIAAKINPEGAFGLMAGFDSREALVRAALLAQEAG